MFAASKTASSGVAPDPQFNYVTMLLHGDGTNGAQNNTFLDSSTNNFSITRNGNTTQGSFSPYGSNWSNYFQSSGSFQYLQVANNTALQFGTGDFTVEGWFYMTGATFSNNSLFSIGSFNGGFLLRYRAAGSDNFYFNNTGYDWNPSSNFVLNKWNHVAVVRSGTTVSIYVNGTSVFSVTNSSSLTQSTATSIGTATHDTNNEACLGYISNFRMVKGTAVYTANFTPPTAPLIAITNTSLLTCQSNRFIDNSANAFTVTPTGTPSVQRFNPFGTSTAYSTSVIGGSGYFDGSGDYLFLASNAAFQFGTGDFTVEGWFYQTADNTYPTALELGPHISGNAIIFITKYGGNATIYSNGFYGATTTTLNQWNHIAWVRSSGSLKIYVNGVSPAGVAFTNNLTDTSTGIGIGDSVSLASANYDYSGYMSNMRVVKGTAVYTANFTPPTTPLTAISGTSLLTNFTNGAIFDNAMMNDLETVGNAQISTSVVKYGTGSLAFDGTGDNLIAPSSPNLSFGTGDFTIEGWVYLNSVSGFQTLVSIRISGSDATTGHYSLAFRNAALEFYASGGVVTSGGTASISTWTHFACTRSSGSVRLFLNGTQVGSTASFTTSIPEKIVAIASNNGGSEYLNGYIDDLRITKGYARYTANFTPPTAAFSNTGPY